MKKTFVFSTLAALALLDSRLAFASELPEQIENCAVIRVDTERLQCFDRLASSLGNAKSPLVLPGMPQPDVKTADHVTNPSEPFAVPAAEEKSVLARHWELGRADKRGIFAFRPHNDNYLLASYNPSPNEAPYEPFRAINPNLQGLSNFELAFQLGFKLKAVENLFQTPADLWFGYTQRSFWQAGNSKASSPFRETNYQPEIMMVIPTDLNLLGLRMRLLNLGFTHQSNGQTSVLSRSWNRLYAQAGLERGNFTLLARAWKRIEEDEEADDNPDITDYMGHGDMVATYRWNEHEFSLLARRNFHTDKGAAQLSWAFPLVSNLKGYMQYFTGYGHTLIDYNSYQRVLGLGVLVELE
jgi:phospholipase A1/A2